MKGKRRAHSDKFKAKIAIEAIKGIKTLSELATEYKIHPVMLLLELEFRHHLVSWL